MKTVLLVVSVFGLIACSQSAPSVKAQTVTNVEEQSTPPAATTEGLEQFLGHWRSTGDTFGQKAISVMDWHQALDGKFIVIDYGINAVEAKLNADSTGIGRSIFRGSGYYQLADGPKLNGFWADTSGDLHPIRANIEGGTLTSVWGVEGGKLGKTRYALNGDGTLTVTDWIMRDGEFRQFNQNTFSNIDDAAGQ